MVSHALCNPDGSRANRLAPLPCRVTRMLVVCLALFVTSGCMTPPAGETGSRDPFDGWTIQSRLTSSDDHVWGWSEKARETERRLGYR